jgi:sugar lactone lactonase YvrE
MAFAASFSRPVRLALFAGLCGAFPISISGLGCSDSDESAQTPATTGGSAGQANAAGAGGASGSENSAGAQAEGGAAGAGVGGESGQSGQNALGGSGGGAAAGSDAGASGAAGNGAAGESGVGGTDVGGSSGNGGSGGMVKPPVQFADTYPVGAAYPEGGAYDHDEDAFFVGSLKDGTVHRIDAQSGAETTYFKETAAGKWWTLGMDVDHLNRRLWVCALDDRSPNPRAGRVWGFDLKTGERIADWDLSTAQADATCTDVSVTTDGTVYVCDREAPTVYQLTVDQGPKVFASDPLLDGDVAGMNGMITLPDQSALLTVVYRPARLVRVDLQTAAATEVKLTGPFNDPSILAGADGITLDFEGKNAYVAFTNRFIQVKPGSSAWATGSASAIDDVPEGLTDVIATPGGLYWLNGQSIAFALNTIPKPFALQRFTGSFL